MTTMILVAVFGLVLWGIAAKILSNQDNFQIKLDEHSLRLDGIERKLVAIENKLNAIGEKLREIGAGKESS